MINFKSIEVIIDNALLTVKRFPFVLLAALLATLYAIYTVENNIRFEDAKTVFTLMLGVPLFFSFDLFLEAKNIKTKKNYLLGALITSLLLYIYHRSIIYDETGTFFIKALQTSLAAHLLVSFLPFLGKEKGFWQFNISLFLRLLFSFLYSSVFFIGLLIAIFTIDKLFSIAIDNNWYKELWFVSAFLFQTWYFLGGVPKNWDALESEQPYPKPLRLFVQHLLIPLVSLYMVILYFYMGKILISWDWPRGYVGWLVSIMSVVGIFNLLLIDPEKDKADRRWIAVYSKYYYIFILPLLLMLFFAISKRISEYGWTEKRYFLAALGALLLGLTVYFIFSKKKLIKVIPISLFTIVILSLFGPWSAYNVSLYSQYNRAKNLLERHGLLVDETAVKAKTAVSFEDEKQLSSIFNYIVKNHGSDKIKSWFPDSVISRLSSSEYHGGYTKVRHQSPAVLMEHLGLKYINRFGSEKHYFSYSSSYSKIPLNISGFTHMIPFNSYNNKMINIDGVVYNVRLRNQSVLILKDREEIVRFPLEELAENAKQSPRISDEEVPNGVMMVEGESEVFKASLFVKKISGTLNGPKIDVENVQSILLFKL